MKTPQLPWRLRLRFWTLTWGPSRIPSWLPLRGRPGWLLPALCLLLAAACALMYARAQRQDTSGYVDSIALLRQLKQLDAHWELDALKSRTGLNRSYDALVNPLQELSELPRQLAALAATRDSRAAVQLRAAVTAYEEALTSKTTLMESFKSHNAVLRNSLGFLPTAVGDIEAWPGRGGGRQVAAANRVLLATLVYSQQPSDAGLQEVRAELAVLAGLAAAGAARGLPQDGAAQERIALFVAHVQAVMREQGIVERLLGDIFATGTAARIDAIGAILAQEQQQALQRLQTSRLLLTLLALALAGVLAALALRLMRSHATIRRVNGKLQHANEHLEGRVRNRTAALEQANASLKNEMAERKLLESRLVQSEKLASIGQLAAGVAHEINNPLAFVAANFGMLETYLPRLLEILAAYEAAEASMAAQRGQGQLAAIRARIELDFLKEDIPQLLSESRGGMQRVARIVQDLKNFSHAGAEQQWEIADLRPGLKSTLNVIAKQLRDVADVETDYAAMPEVECLPSQLNQVFMNLMINAAHAIGPQRGRITIRTGGDASEAWVDIIDTGCGIPDEVLPRIFDPFYTTKAIGKDTGLGLSLSYGIVKQHGGRIDVSTEPGVGSTFRVVLPLRRQPAQALAAARAASQSLPPASSAAAITAGGRL